MGSLGEALGVGSFSRRKASVRSRPSISPWHPSASADAERVALQRPGCGGRSESAGAGVDLGGCLDRAGAGRGEVPDSGAMVAAAGDGGDQAGLPHPADPHPSAALLRPPTRQRPVGTHPRRPKLLTTHHRSGLPQRHWEAPLCATTSSRIMVEPGPPHAPHPNRGDHGALGAVTPPRSTGRPACRAVPEQ